MGIEGLSVFLKKKKLTDVYRAIPANKFEGTRIAIDFFQVLYKYAAAATKQTYSGMDLRLNPEGEPNMVEYNKILFGYILNLITNLCSFGITPVLVFDGPNKSNKEKTRKERQDKIEKDRKSAQDLREKLKEQDILERSNKDLEDYRKILCRDLSVSYENILDFRAIFENMGLCVLTADGDGEHLCCALALGGHVAAVYSDDSDCIAHGCPLIIRGITEGTYGSRLTFDTVAVGNILQQLSGFTYPMFLDFCITCGCDYNEGIPQIGVMRAHSLIVEFGRISNFPAKWGKYELDLDKLDVEKCYYEFRKVDSYQELLFEKHSDPESEVTYIDDIVFDARRTDSREMGIVEDILSSKGLTNKSFRIEASMRNLYKVADKMPHNILPEGVPIDTYNFNIVLEYEEYEYGEKLYSSNTKNIKEVDIIADIKKYQILMD